MKVKTNFTIDEELIPKIKKEGEVQDRSDSHIVNQILIEHFEREEKRNGKKKG
jgi:hypothetical protein